MPPPPTIIKINTDGATTETTTEIGMIFRNHLYEFEMVAWKNVGMIDSYIAECTTIVIAGEIAVSKG
ncbi:hypothetical protein FRX31_007667 [Thalictrum thalictroides]|uniref:Uncharacterized protein n=1 Tax=Thalictrum thalictroides TaxID=46969 RepID=A0A7J6X1M4_THATH|nr:hypothetical protein FRX31_007667 [Thalictrum thalictroides]